MTIGPQKRVVEHLGYAYSPGPPKRGNPLHEYRLECGHVVRRYTAAARRSRCLECEAARAAGATVPK